MSRDVILTSNQKWTHEGFVGLFSLSPVCLTYILHTYVWNYPDPYFTCLYLHYCNYTLDYIIIYCRKSMLLHWPHVPAVEAVGGNSKNYIHSSKRNYKVVQIWPGLFTLVYIQISPGHIWTTLYKQLIYKSLALDGQKVISRSILNLNWLP